MRLSFFFIFSIFLSSSLHAQEKAKKSMFTLTGKVIGQEDGRMILTYLNNDKRDTCFLKKGEFHFKQEITEPTMAVLRGAVKSIADDDPNAVSFFIEPTAINVQLKYNEFKDIKITGSKTQTEFEGLKQKINTITDKGDNFSIKYEAIIHNFILNNPHSYVSSFELSMFSNSWPIDTVFTLYHKLGTVVKNSIVGKNILEKINNRNNNRPNNLAKDFSAIDLNKKNIKLSNFKGKYVVLDFWASWCVPCRANTPRIIELFKNYHNRGLEIISIASDDSTPNKWKEAIINDKTAIWYHVLNGMVKNKNNESDASNSIGSKYAISLLPTLILIDQNGVILGRYEGSDSISALETKINEIFLKKHKSK